jgi:hypothetical protein
MRRPDDTSWTRSVAHQCAGFGILASRIYRGHPVDRRQESYLDTPCGKEWAGADEEGVGPLAHNGREGRIDLPTGAGVEHLDLQPHGARSPFRVFHDGPGIRSLGRIDEHGHAFGCGE